MSGPAADLNLVQRFWALYQAREWGAVQALLHPEAHCQWWATAERFEGAAAVVHVNAVYPEGWTIHLLELNALGTGGQASADAQSRRRVHSLVRVDHGAQSFYANSFFSLERDLIVSIDEYWSDTQAAPAWRQNGSLPGLIPMAVDQRQGLSLQVAAS
jgi:hypothetical protein